MRDWDGVLPERILRVWYEGVVEDLEGNVRRILEFCGPDFEPARVEFYKTERSVRTASSEQVRLPGPGGFIRGLVLGRCRREYSPVPCREAQRR
jgi:hypothetical protein